MEKTFPFMTNGIWREQKGGTHTKGTPTGMSGADRALWKCSWEALRNREVGENQPEMGVEILAAAGISQQ